MNLPNLPTDNLYKFIALSGIAISISCALAVVYLVEDLNRNDWDVKTTGVLVAQQLQTNLNAVDILDDYEKTYNPKDTDKAFGQLILQERLKIQKDISSMFDMLHNSLTKESTLVAQKQTLKDHGISLTGGVYGGMLISAIGLFLWYWKLQRHQDRIAFLEAVDKKKELENPKPNPS